MSSLLVEDNDLQLTDTKNESDDSRNVVRLLVCSTEIEGTLRGLVNIFGSRPNNRRTRRRGITNIGASTKIRGDDTVRDP
jgi:hypothetical protein